MAHFLPPEHVRQVNKLEWPYIPFLTLVLLVADSDILKQNNLKKSLRMTETLAHGYSSESPQ